MKYFIYCRKSTEDEGKQIQSIEDQAKFLTETALARDLEVIGIFRESKSAKAPGRPFFNQMIDQISQGKAQGILCWKLDRLARNPVDGGSINWMLQQGIIQKIVTSDRDYCPTDNVLMMSVEFGMANQFIRDLGKNTKRGMVSKCQKGWLPTTAPLGYLNNRYCEKGDRSIIKDELRFPLVRKMWDLMLSGQYSVQDICDIANVEWGLTMPKRRKIGGNPLGLSTLYNIFSNSFYYGEFDWDGETYQGGHEPMITRAEFDYVQRILGGKGKPRPIAKQFPFTGLIRCGKCGCMITAEDKNKFIRSKGEIKNYIYYHCTHKKKELKCSQRSIEEKELVKQVNDFLDTLTIEDELIDWIIRYLHEFDDKEVFERSNITKSLETKLNECTKRLDNLIKLKISGDLLTDEEFKVQKASLMAEKATALQGINSVSTRQNNWIDSAEKAIDFLRSVKKRFSEGTVEAKKLILSTLGSNLALKDGKLSIQANGVYQPLQNGIDQTKELNIRFETAKGRLNTTKKAYQTGLYSIWLPRLGSNQRPSR